MWMLPPPARARPTPTYRRGDLVRCGACRRSFVATAKVVSCARCGSREVGRLTPLAKV